MDSSASRLAYGVFLERVVAEVGQLNAVGIAGFEVHAPHQRARLHQVTEADTARLQALSASVPGRLPQSTELHLAKRSSESHLHRLYGRLGAAGRADLPGLSRLFRLLESEAWSACREGC